MSESPWSLCDDATPPFGVPSASWVSDTADCDFAPERAVVAGGGGFTPAAGAFANCAKVHQSDNDDGKGEDSYTRVGMGAVHYR